MSISTLAAAGNITDTITMAIRVLKCPGGAGAKTRRYGWTQSFAPY